MAQMVKHLLDKPDDLSWSKETININSTKLSSDSPHMLWRSYPHTTHHCAHSSSLKTKAGEKRRRIPWALGYCGTRDHKQVCVGTEGKIGKGVQRGGKAAKLSPSAIL